MGSKSGRGGDQLAGRSGRQRTGYWRGTSTPELRARKRVVPLRSPRGETRPCGGGAFSSKPLTASTAWVSTMQRNMDCAAPVPDMESAWVLSKLRKRRVGQSVAPSIHAFTSPRFSVQHSPQLDPACQSASAALDLTIALWVFSLCSIMHTRQGCSLAQRAWNAARGQEIRGPKCRRATTSVFFRVGPLDRGDMEAHPSHSPLLVHSQSPRPLPSRSRRMMDDSATLHHQAPKPRIALSCPPQTCAPDGLC